MGCAVIRGAVTAPWPTSGPRTGATAGNVSWPSLNTVLKIVQTLVENCNFTNGTANWVPDLTFSIFNFVYRVLYYLNGKI